MSSEKNLASRLLGETPGTLHLQGLDAIRTTSLAMATQATRELRIYSHDLEATVYDNLEFLESVRRLALRSARASVEILLFDPEPAVRNGHRLIELARQIPSNIQIRCVPEEFRHQVAAYLIADDAGYVLRPVADVFEGTADFSAPMQVRHMRGEFEHFWESSSRPHELITFGRGL